MSGAAGDALFTTRSLTPLLLDKVLTLFVMPVGVACIAGALALAVAARGLRRGAVGLIAFTTVWLWAWSTPFVAGCVTRPLVERYPPRPAVELPAADAIVLLAGPDAERVRHSARLYHAGKAPLIIVTGGLVWDGPALSEARVLQRQLRALGVPDHALLIEDDSRNTRQNALFTAELAATLGIEHVLLVTSAWHMPRAAAAFGRTALHVIAAAPSRRIRGTPSIFQALPNAPALSASTAALREYLGLVVYRLRGWT